MPTTRAEDIETLKRRADSLSAKAQALTDRYNRTTWFRFALTFFPVPFAVLLFRLQLDYWHYYLAGGAYMVFSAALYAYDRKASDRCDRAHEEAEKAQRELQQTQAPAAQ